jgi:hypothetical protein
MRATTKNSSVIGMTSTYRTDAINQYDFQAEAGTDPVSFKAMNAKILRVIEEWDNTRSARTHTFYTIYQEKWKNSTSTYKTVQSNLGMQSLNDYILHVKQCPAIQAQFDIYYNSVKKKLIYQNKELSDPLTPKKTPGLSDIATHNTDESIDSPPTNEFTTNLNPSFTDHTTIRSITDHTNIGDNEDGNNDEHETNKDIKNDNNDVIDNGNNDDTSSEKSTIKLLPELMPEETLHLVQLDIADEETTSGPAMTQINRFLHYFRNKYNSATGEFGNKIMLARQHVEQLVNQAEQDIQKLESQLTVFEQNYETTMTATTASMSNVTNRIDLLQAEIEMRIDTAGSRITQIGVCEETKIKQVANETTDKIKTMTDNISNHIKTEIQDMITHLEPIMSQYTQKLHKIGMDAISQMELVAGDLLQEIQKMHKQPEPTPTVRLNPNEANMKTTWRGIPLDISPNPGTPSIHPKPIPSVLSHAHGDSTRDSWPNHSQHSNEKNDFTTSRRPATVTSQT